MFFQYSSFVFPLFLVAAFTSFVFGQGKTEDKAQGTKLVPPRLSPALPFATPEVALAKADETGKTLRMIVPKFKIVSITREVPVTRMTSVVKTRVVVNKDGEQVEQQYTVQVPYTETVTQVHSALEADSEDRIKIPIDRVSAWRLDGTRIEQDDLLKRYSKPMHFLVARKNFFPGVPTYFREALNPKMVVIFVGKDYAEKFVDTAKSEKPSSKK